MIEGNIRERRLATKLRVGYTTSESYGLSLQQIDSDLEFEIAYPNDKDWHGIVGGYEGFDGAVITGSSLHIGDSCEYSQRQVDFTREILSRGVPIFGSCWGLQVLVVAMGGEVETNKNGREVGIGRAIKLNRVGQDHAMYLEKDCIFDVVSVHTDHVVKIPDNSVLLASNEMSEVQALELNGGSAVCWGVQYHPEFSLSNMADILDVYGPETVRVGVFPDMTYLESMIEAMRCVNSDKDRYDLRRLYGWGDDVVDPITRMRELKNWLDQVVKPRADA